MKEIVDHQPVGTAKLFSLPQTNGHGSVAIEEHGSEGGRG
jgi:hypothetical protein